jgi:putative molybdopterin biosynthesis protein
MLRAMTPRPDDGPWLTSREVSALLRVHPKHIYRLLKRGLPGRRVGGEWRFRRDEVLSWSRGADALPEPTPSSAPVSLTASTAGCALLAANGDVVVRALLGLLNAGEHPLWGFAQCDRAQALRWLSEGRVTAAGSHGGIPPTRAGEARLARIHLVEREVGLVARRDAKVPTLKGLHRARLASRPATAGVHAHLVDALRAAKVSPERALSRAKTYASHAEVIEAVLRDEADVGLTTAALAARYGLAFRALATERYGLLVRSADLGTPLVVRLCEVAQSTALRAALTGVAGYDPSRSGEIVYDPEAG